MINKTNEMLIDTYKEDTRIITDFYKYKDNKGDIIELNGIINPLKIDNRQLMSPTDNQREFSACAGFSAATYIESLLWKYTGKLKQLDSLQVYQLSKQIDNMRDVDGTLLEYSLRAVLKLCEGVKEFDFLKNARINTFFNTKTNDTIEHIKFLIHKYDFLQAGFMCQDSWMKCNNENYVIDCSGNNLGGHAILINFYDNEYIGITNQWGIEWGAKGSALMKWKDFLENFMYCAYIDF